MEIRGLLKVKYDTQVVSEKFKKREFVLTTEHTTPYPQHLIIQVTNDKCYMLDRFNEGDELIVNINLRGREWNGPQGVKYFNTIEAWKIELLNQAIPGNMQPVNGVPNNTQPTAQTTSVNNSVNNSANTNEDLPF